MSLVIAGATLSLESQDLLRALVVSRNDKSDFKIFQCMFRNLKSVPNYDRINENVTSPCLLWPIVNSNSFNDGIGVFEESRC